MRAEDAREELKVLMIFLVWYVDMLRKRPLFAKLTCFRRIIVLTALLLYPSLIFYDLIS